MREIILGKYGEIALKGLNRNKFEQPLMKTIKRRLEDCGSFKVYSAQSTVYVEPTDEYADIDKAYGRMEKVFGLAGLGKAAVCEKDFDTICKTAAEYLDSSLSGVKTFKVKARRADKKFPMTSMEIAAELGGYILDRYPNLTVDLFEPELTIMVEIRDKVACVHAKQQRGAGGIPTGTGGKAACMLSGGIDSPVAAWMMARRGCEIIGVHFMSPPYTGEGALYKVERLAQKVAQWCGRICLFEVPFTECQLAIRDNAPEEYFTVLMRRSMLRITEKIAVKEGCEAIVTGESLGQVASQTMSAIGCTDDVAIMPVFRPLIGNDKIEISDRAKEIDTFDISIEPFEDCCTIFTPKHPKTQPEISHIRDAEKGIPELEKLEQKAADEVILKIVRFNEEV